MSPIPGWTSTEIHSSLKLCVHGALALRISRRSSFPRFWQAAEDMLGFSDLSSFPVSPRPVLSLREVVALGCQMNALLREVTPTCGKPPPVRELVQPSLDVLAVGGER